MHSKLALIILTVLTLSSCGWVQDKPKDTQKFQSKNLDLTCLQNAPIQVQKLFNGEYTHSAADMAEEREIWSCLDFGLNSFAAYTHGANEGYYTAEELQTFANRYLPKDKLFTAQFVNTIFRLKGAVVGGDESKLTHEEIIKVRGKIIRFGTVIEPLVPYISAILDRTVRESRRKLEAGAALNVFVGGLAGVLGDSATSVQWTDLKNFIIQLELYTSKGKPSSLTLVREQIDIFKAFKLLIVGGEEDAIEREKWAPIFQSISHAYNAIFMTSTTAAMLEKLSIEVQSTETEQQRAVNNLKEVFVRLKKDQTLVSHVGIVQISDRFAKMLLVNTFLFPRNRGSLALKSFLGSEALRKIAGSIVQEFPKPGTRVESSQVLKMADLVMNFLDQAAISNLVRNEPTPPVSITWLQEDLEGLAPLLEDKSERDLIYTGLNVLKQAIPVLIGKDADHLSPKDLRQLVQKSLDLYFTWVPTTPKSINEQIGASLDIVVRPPSVNTVAQSELLTTLNELQKVLKLMNVATPFDFNVLRGFVRKGMKLKSVLFQNSESSISSYELSQISYLWDPFRRNDDLSVAMAASANLLANRPFSEVEIDDLFTALDAFMPEGESLANKGLNAKVLGDLKFLLVGGGKNSIKPAEYSTLVRSISVLYSKLAPKLKNLPKDYAPGFNSTTVDLASGVFEGFIAARSSDIPLLDLKTLILDMAQTAGFKVRPSTINKLLIGFNTRIFNHSKGQKPASLSGQVLKTAQLKVMLPLLEQIRVELLDLENAYAGLNSNKTTLTRAQLLARLKNAENRIITEKIQPLLDGDTHLHRFPKKYVVNDRFYEYDLAYKTSIHSVLNWLLPFYKIEEDVESKRIRISLNDLADLFTDINDLIFDLKLSYSNAPPMKASIARMQNMNLFTRVGNGDAYMDALEGTEFLTITSGGKVLIGKIQDALFPKCFPGITDYNTVTKIPYSCLSRVFFAKDFIKNIYSPVIPQMVDQYLKWTPEQIEVYRKGAFTATRPDWTENGSLPLADFESLISLPYFLENVFERFDEDEDDLLRFSELMNAFPIFCREIASASGGKLKGSCVPGEFPGQIEAIYGYLLFYGHPPTGMEPGNSIWRRFRTTAGVLMWFRTWRNLDRSPEIRDLEAPFIGRQDLLSIISNLAASAKDAEDNPELAPFELE